MSRDNKQIWISNAVADEIVNKLQKSPDSKSTQQMMDLVSGVPNYRIFNKRKQGVIRRIFNKECKNTGRSYGGNFDIDLDDVIGAFWEAVIKYLPRATTTGSTVSVRIVDGQSIGEGVVDVNGLTFTNRTTKCNPIHYLRNMGIMGVRNLLNKSYRKNIIQVCDDCGDNCTISSIETSPLECDRCQSRNTEKCWPDGNSSYRSKKSRRCLECGNIWVRTFAKSCTKCKSTNIHADARVSAGDEMMVYIPDTSETADTSLITFESEQIISRHIDKMFKSMPVDPKDPTLYTKTHDVFNILLVPEASRDMCNKCVASAPVVCSQGCYKFIATGDCIHDKIPDPKISCGSATFSIAKCLNYSKKIAQYHQCSASLTSRRITKVREYIRRYIKTNANDPDMAYLNILLERLDKLSK